MNGYLLNAEIALRSWRFVPYAYYRKGRKSAQGLYKDEFDFLMQCDGKTELEPNDPLVKRFMENGFIAPAKQGAALTDWQKYLKCDNRYVPAMSWAITEKCSNDCLHCQNAADNASEVSEWTLKEARTLIEQARRCGINAVTIAGGEPMLHPHFFEMIECIYANGMYVSDLHTSGCFINQAALGRLCDIGCKPLIKICFDGSGNKNAQADMLRAVRLCVEHGFSVSVQAKVHRLSAACILAAAELLDQMGADEMCLIRTLGPLRLKENAGDVCPDVEEYYEKMLRFAEGYRKKNHRMNIDIEEFLALFPQTKSYRMRPVEYAAGKYRGSVPICRASRGIAAVAANGDLYPCMQLSGMCGAHSELIGNVKTDGLQALLQSGEYLNGICTAFGQLSGQKEKCAQCSYLKHCGGSCRVRVSSVSAKCVFFQKGWYKKIEKTLFDWENTAPMMEEGD